MAKSKNDLKKELDIMRVKNLPNLKWSTVIKNDDYVHLSMYDATKIILEAKLFNPSSKILDLSKTKYELIEEFSFHSFGIKKIILPKTILILGKFCFANNQIEELNLSYYDKLEIIEDFAFAYNKIKKYLPPPNLILFTKKVLFKNPYNKVYKN